MILTAPDTVRIIIACISVLDFIIFIGLFTVYLIANQIKNDSKWIKINSGIILVSYFSIKTCIQYNIYILC